MRDTGATPEAREGQRLIVGPWTHLNMTGLFPERGFGPGANIETLNLTAVHLAFFDRWLKGDGTVLDSMAAVKIFVMGANEWRDEQEWPPTGVRYVDFHLDGGPANGVGGTGQLSEKPASPFTQTYLYDPRRPVPTTGGDTMSLEEFGGPVDQRPVEVRDDVLCFSTEPLERPIQVIGPVSLTLFVSSSAVDTDFTAKLVDVEADGRAIIVCDGIRRMRHRNSRAADERMVPGEIYQITVDLGPTATVFLRGHRIRLEVSSSNFPKHDRNSNTGGDIVSERLEDMVIAINHLHHGPDHPSRLVLPVMER
jgi:putative CocE/NonD family hydrolase